MKRKAMGWHFRGTDGAPFQENRSIDRLVFYGFENLENGGGGGRQYYPNGE